MCIHIYVYELCAYMRVCRVFGCWGQMQRSDFAASWSPGDQPQKANDSTVPRAIWSPICMHRVSMYTHPEVDIG